MVISTGTAVTNFTAPHQLKYTPVKIDHHSGLTPDEMLIPLIVWDTVLSLRACQTDSFTQAYCQYEK